MLQSATPITSSPLPLHEYTTAHSCHAHNHISIGPAPSVQILEFLYRQHFYVALLGGGGALSIASRPSVRSVPPISDFPK